MFTIKSITAQIHDTSYGGYPYKIVVQVDVDAKAYSKLPVLQKARHTLCGYRAASRDLGSLVIKVNNAVYALNHNVPAHNPSIDSKGDKRAKNGVKRMEFVYFFNDQVRAQALGYEFHGTGCAYPKAFQTIDLLNLNKAASNE